MRFHVTVPHQGMMTESMKSSVSFCPALCLQNTQKEGERKSLLGSEQNYYKQLYLESSGQPGDLRISEVTFGDPAAQGSIFVHERI